MTEYREILRLHALGFSQRNIANSCHASKTTVSHVLKKPKSLVSPGHLMKIKPMEH